MLEMLIKRRMRKINRIVIDDTFRQAHSVHSIALEELKTTIANTESQYVEFIRDMSNDNLVKNKGC